MGQKNIHGICPIVEEVWMDWKTIDKEEVRTKTYLFIYFHFAKYPNLPLYWKENWMID